MKSRAKDSVTSVRFCSSRSVPKSITSTRSWVANTSSKNKTNKNSFTPFYPFHFLFYPILPFFTPFYPFLLFFTPFYPLLPFFTPLLTFFKNDVCMNFGATRNDHRRRKSKVDSEYAEPDVYSTLKDNFVLLRAEPQILSRLVRFYGSCTF